MLQFSIILSLSPNIIALSLYVLVIVKLLILIDGKFTVIVEFFSVAFFPVILNATSSIWKFFSLNSPFSIIVVFARSSFNTNPSSSKYSS